jgi:hypothetical protein
LIPGPGSYTPSVRMSLKTSPKFKIGSSTRDKFYLKDRLKLELPPPNSYNPSIDFVKKASPATGFGYGNRNILSRSFNIPGPGSYTSPSRIGEGPKFHISMKLEDNTLLKKAKEVPSPDNYTPSYNNVLRTQSVFSVSKSRRKSLSNKNNVPGPGTYYDPSIISSFKGSPRFGFGSSLQRPSNLNKIEVPGPGYYRVNCTFADVPNYLIPNQNEEFKFV